MQRKLWSLEEEQQLVDMWGKVPVAKIAKMFDRTIGSVNRKVERLGLKMDDEAYTRVTGKKRWTEKEKEVLKEYYGKKRTWKIAEMLNRPEQDIRKQAQYLGITETAHIWTEEEMDYLSANWGSFSIQQIAKSLNVTDNAVKLKAMKLGLRKQLTGDGAYLGVYEIAKIMHIDSSSVYGWIEKGLLNTTRLRVGKVIRKRIKHEDFIAFLFKNQNLYNTKDTDIETIRLFSLGKFGKHDNSVPEWLELKIASDKLIEVKKRKDWNTQEEKKLLKMLDEGKSIRDVSIVLNRTEDSIRGKLRCINLLTKG